MTSAACAVAQVQLDTGETLDTVVYERDFVHLAGQAGVNLHGDLLAVLVVGAENMTRCDEMGVI
eukprot:1146327-Pelagomonas_calceolata.AAC.3